MKQPTSKPPNNQHSINSMNHIYIETSSSHMKAPTSSIPHSSLLPSSQALCLHAVMAALPRVAAEGDGRE